MSQVEAKRIIQQVITHVLKNSEVRETLDANIHILDLAYNSVDTANSPGVGRAGRQREIDLVSYGEFITAVRSISTVAATVDIGIQEVLLGGRSQYRLVNDHLLISKNFSAARDFISKVSKLIPDNDNFGTSYRERSLDEYDVEYDMKTGVLSGSVLKLKGRAYISPRGYIGVVLDIAKVGSKRSKIRFQEKTKKRFTHVAVDNLEGTGYLFEAKTKHLNQQIICTNNVVKLVEYIDQKNKKQTVPVIKKQELSVLDLGHVFKMFSPSSRTPLGEKLTGALFSDINNTAKEVLVKYINKLDELHSKVNFEFHNTAADGDSIEYAGGYVVLSIQHHRANNLLAISEGRFMRAARRELAAIAASLPGSNTIIQDINQKIGNLILKTLGGKVNKLVPHKPVLGSINLPNLKPKPSTQAVSGPKKIKISSSSPAVQMRTITGQFTSLVSIQNILNQNLHNQIQQNMGIGDRRDILNYRTGRFAESARVEKMSQSREGMITAFYSYMRNPYATFSFGGAQQQPASRDPKLLISKSIREIGATMVGNRMRAVLV